MALKSLNQEISLVFFSVDKETKQLKSALIGLCSDADRYFRLALGIDIYNSISDKDFNKIKFTFPSLRELNIEQFNRLLSIFISIRDLSAHLFLCKPIYIDNDIKEFLSNAVSLPYQLVGQDGMEATLFGVFCVAVALSQKYQLWSFVTSAIRTSVILEAYGKEIAEFQREFQLGIQPLAGKGKPYYPSPYIFLDKMSVVFFIEEIKKLLTRLIFDFESYSRTKSTTRTPSFKSLLKKYRCLKDKPDLINRIAELRNYWLHGYRLFDYIHTEDKEIQFDFNYLFGILLDIRSFFSDTHYYRILNDINECGSNMLDFYALRLIEVSYKILDKQLFDKEKVKHRINNSIKAYSRLAIPDLWFFDNSLRLLTQDKKWYLTAGKFLDKQARQFVSNQIEIYEFHSNDGFDINDEHVDIDTLVLVDVPIPNESQCSINGKLLTDYQTNNIESRGMFYIYKIDVEYKQE